jgi:tetratricopeptide (TPR) repeat protein
MKTFSTHRFLGGRCAAIAAPVLLALVTQSASAHEYEALIKAKKYAEVERAVAAKLATEANNADALVAKTELILIEAKDSRLDEAAKIAEQCIASHPQNSECHEALGNVLGTKAQKGGLMSAMGSLGKIRDSFKKAVELDPKNLTARSSLMQFYLEAPGFAGGGTSKAKDLIVDTGKVSPASASLLQAALELKEDNFEKASAVALAVNAKEMPVIAQQQRDVLSSIGFAYIKEKKLAEAEKMFREIMQRFSDASIGYYGLGRALHEQGKYKEALSQLEKSLSLDASAGTFYRLGKTWQAIGDKVKAVSAFEKALAFRPELSKKARSDVEDQLKALK